MARAVLSVVAMDAFHKFVRTGIKTFAFIDSHFQLMSAFN